MIEAGTILQNRYRIEQHIGQGGMGKVYVAIDERFNSTVAIKETVFEEENLRKAFEREARLLNSLKHSALPRVSDHFNERNGQFLVMEYIAGDDLAEMLERKGKPFPLADVLKWTGQLCDALDYLHSQGIIHRDIKPQNLKLTPGGQIVLLDFGLAKGNPTDAQHQTAAKSIFGYSRSYASLEQIQGTGTEPRSDLYSLGATVYHLLTGIPPADALTRAMNVLNGQSDPLIEANFINNKVPVGVSAILQKTMALNAAERPESAVSMKSMLDDSDKNIDSAYLNSAVTNPFAIDFSTRDTEKVAATNVSNPNQSQIVTKILSENASSEKYKTNISGANSESKVTRMRQPFLNTESASPKKRIGLAAAGILLLIAGAICGVYLYNFDVPQSNTSDGNTNNTNESSFAVTAPLNEELQKEETIVNSDSAQNGANTKQTDKQAASKSTAATTTNSAKKTTNQSKNTDASRSSKKVENEEENIVVNGETVEMGNMIVDENGIRMKNAPNKPPIPPEQFKGFNIQQLRRLERFRNAKKRVIIVSSPKPTPLP